MGFPWIWCPVWPYQFMAAHYLLSFGVYVAFMSSYNLFYPQYTLPIFCTQRNQIGPNKQIAPYTLIYIANPHFIIDYKVPGPTKACRPPPHGNFPLTQTDNHWRLRDQFQWANHPRPSNHCQNPSTSSPSYHHCQHWSSKHTRGNTAADSNPHFNAEDLTIRYRLSGSSRVTSCNNSHHEQIIHQDW